MGLVTICSGKRVYDRGLSRCLYLCSDGVERFTEELAEYAEVTPNTIRVRICTKGLDHPKILSGYVKPGHSLVSGIMRGDGEPGTREWQDMGE